VIQSSGDSSICSSSLSLKVCRPVYGLIFLFKWQQEKDDRQTQSEEEYCGRVFFAKQVMSLQFSNTFFILECCHVYWEGRYSTIFHAEALVLVCLYIFIVCYLLINFYHRGSAWLLKGYNPLSGQGNSLQATLTSAWCTHPAHATLALLAAYLGIFLGGGQTEILYTS